MLLVPKLPQKVQFVLSFSFPIVANLCRKTLVEQFVGGRPGYNKEILFGWLLVKKVTNWDYRTIASMAGVVERIDEASSIALKNASAA
jgi:hypothetical protein